MTKDEVQKMSMEIGADFMRNMQWYYVWPNVEGPEMDTTNTYPQTDCVLTESEKVKYVQDAAAMAACIAAAFFTSMMNVNQE